MPSSVTLKGNPVALSGTEIKVGDQFPDVKLSKSLAEEVSISSFKGKKVVLSVVPSLDTPVCDLQGRRFNSELGNLGDGVVVAMISRDLPPAMARWCGAAEADKDKLHLLSDYKLREFGQATGTELPGLGILCRAVFVLDADGKVIHAEYVGEIAEHPDYDAALAAAK